MDALPTRYLLPLLLCLKLAACAAERPGKGIEVFFSPKAGCTEAVVSELGKARRRILVQAYSFTSASLAKALVDLHTGGA